MEFRCQMTHEQVERQRKYDTIVAHVVLPVTNVLLVGIMSFLIYITYGELQRTPDWTASEFLLPMVVMFGAVALVMAIVVYMTIVAIELSRTLEPAYSIMETKVFGWDTDKREFFYIDTEHRLRFKGDDVDKWVSVMNQGGVTTDIMRLRSGEQIVLEGKFNADIYPFLRENRLELNLPKPKPFTWTINTYTNPI